MIQMCSDIACVDEAVARVFVKSADGHSAESIVCKRHLARIKAAHAERPSDWPQIDLAITELT